MYALVNCDIFTGDEFLSNSAVVIDGARIASILEEKDLSDEIEKINLEGKTVVPGFIDLQVNGGGGVLFNDSPSVEGIGEIFEGHNKYGTTDFLPTFITGSSDGMSAAANAVNHCLANNLYGVRGIHYEGPFLDEGKAGVHDKSYIRSINPNDLSVIKSIEGGKILLTVAPETMEPNDLERLVSDGIILSIGHTAADYETAMAAFSSGATCSTHLYNAMSALGSRAPGVVGATLDNDKIWSGIIVDGHHADFAAVRIAYKAKSKGKLFLVTDAMPPVGGDGSGFVLGDYDIAVEEGRCITMGDVLAGSALDMATAVRNCIQNVGIDKGEALRMASRYPAEFIGLSETIGSVQAGFDANLAIINNQIEVSSVVLQGVHKLV